VATDANNDRAQPECIKALTSPSLGALRARRCLDLVRPTRPPRWGLDPTGSKRPTITP